MVNYIKENPDVSDVLMTGGDPMVMHAAQLARYIDAILTEPGCDHLAVIRIGTKSLSYVLLTLVLILPQGRFYRSGIGLIGT